MEIFQSTFVLSAKPKGIHLVTNEILKMIPELEEINTGILNLFLNHTSAALSINENADIDVRSDMENHLERAVPPDRALYRHTLEGDDDMTSHIKSSLFGVSNTIPVANGKLLMGIWQGIYLCEFREGNKSRKITYTLIVK